MVNSRHAVGKALGQVKKQSPSAWHAHQAAGTDAWHHWLHWLVTSMQAGVLPASLTCMVYVLPLPVWPYAKQVALPFLQAAIISLAITGNPQPK